MHRPNFSRQRRGEALAIARGVALRSWTAVRNSPGLLVLAFFLGAALWVFVTDTENPTVVDLFPSPIPVQAVNVGESLAVANQLSSVDIRVAAPRDRWSQLTSANFRAFVDVKSLQAREQQVRVQVEVDGVGGARVVEVIPRTIVVNLEDFVQKDVPVTARLVGTLPIGYELGDASPDTTTAKVEGPQSLVDLVKEAVADVNVTGLTLDFDSSVTLVARGAGGGEIRGVRITPSATRVNVQILQRTLYRTLPLSVKVTGDPAAGYRVTNVSVSPTTIEVQGSIQSLQQLDVLSLPSLDITGQRSDMVRAIQIPLPPGVSTNADSSATVTVSIAPVMGSTRIEVAPVIENPAEQTTVTVLQPSVTVTLQGPVPALNALTPADVQVSLDLKGLAEGTFNVVPKVKVPEGLTVLSVAPQIVSVTLKPQTTP
jgi:YbbR domain-containing protein